MRRKDVAEQNTKYRQRIAELRNKLVCATSSPHLPTCPSSSHCPPVLAMVGFIWACHCYLTTNPGIVP